MNQQVAADIFDADQAHNLAVLHDGETRVAFGYHFLVDLPEIGLR